MEFINSKPVCKLWSLRSCLIGLLHTMVHKGSVKRCHYFGL